MRHAKQEYKQKYMDHLQIWAARPRYKSPDQTLKYLKETLQRWCFRIYNAAFTIPSFEGNRRMGSRISGRAGISWRPLLRIIHVDRGFLDYDQILTAFIEHYPNFVDNLQFNTDTTYAALRFHLHNLLSNQLWLARRQWPISECIILFPTSCDAVDTDAFFLQI